ncbi:uncharacterized protein At3g27210-like [Juglans microcarpa x Juglans regia]|uniref:uncharacterized protein At3g27210-like n=1 Tax=Juglans microcarpa x Juglans regia TaxID=2249226 RepID=UPI001B7F07A5|nr:uncharacterized protein At3g27210-like [Juglans microcarpa x Juglans regia]
MDKCSNHLDVGNSVPVSTTSDSSLKLQYWSSAGSKPEISILTESLFKKDIVKGQNSVAEHALMPLASSGRSSDEEEIYFDPWLWLESDCEDFFSVSGDTTPSCGNTPIHQSCCLQETPHVDKPLPIYMDSPPTSIFEPSSPTVMKKQLIELFQESFRSDAVDHVTQNLQARSKANRSILHIPPNSSNKSLYDRVVNTARSSETSPDVTSYSPSRKGRFAKSVRCCLPNFVPNLSSGGGRKRLSVSRSCKR